MSKFSRKTINSQTSRKDEEYSMFTKQDSAQAFKRMWCKEPKVGEQITFGKILIEIKKIEGDTLFWEEVPWSELKD